MSRRPTTTKQPSMSRTVSSASLAMPPPVKVQTRPPSAMSSSTTGMKHGEDGSEGRLESPNKKARKTIAGVPNGGGSVKGKEGNENGEINIQVVVRCRCVECQHILATNADIDLGDDPLSSLHNHPRSLRPPPVHSAKPSPLRPPPSPHHLSLRLQLPHHMAVLMRPVPRPTPSIKS